LAAALLQLTAQVAAVAVVAVQLLVAVTEAKRTFGRIR
jgi:hypothetical protein